MSALPRTRGPAPVGAPGRIPWRAVGVAATAGAWVGFLAVQAVAGDWLPPAVSLSQFGLGPHGWIFTFWMLCVAAGAGCCYAGSGVRRRPAGWFLAVGIAGTVVMAVVRTDAGGAQHSWHAKVHMVGSILTLGALPIGLAVAMAAYAGWVFRVALALTVLAAVCLVLLVVAAFGIDTLGTGAPAAWAFWQSVAVVTEMVLLTEFAVVVARHRGISTRDRP